MNVIKKLPPVIFVIGSLFVIWLLFFSQPLFSGEIVNATDILTQQYFWSVFIKGNLFEDPCFRTWLPYINAGTPFSGGLDVLFRPVTFLTLLLLPVHTAINYELTLYFFLLGLCMYFYMKELGVSTMSAFFASLFLMLNGEIVSLTNAGHVNKTGAIFPVTLVFWAFERALRRKTLSAFVVAAAALGFQFWQGHVQISFYTCIAVGIYYVIRAGIVYKQEKNIRDIWKLTAFALLMVMVFLLLSAVSFLPLLSFAEVSERSEGVSYEFATSWSMPPEELVTYLVPGFFGLRRANHFEDEPEVLQVPYWGRMPFTQTGRYFGLLPLLFVFLALCFVRNKHVLTLSVVAFVILLLGMGRYIPTYKMLYEYVPGFNMFRAPQMILFLFAFATSALAGFGAEWFLLNFTEHKDKRLRIFLLVCVGLFLLFWLMTIVLPQLKPTLLSQFHEVFFRKGATPEIAEARFLNIFRGFLQFNILFGIALFIIGLRLVKRIRIWALVSAILLMFLVDIWLFDEKYIDTVPIEDSWYISENDAIRYCKSDKGLYRIFSATNTPRSYAVANKYLYHHLFSISGYEAVGVQYYTDYLQHMALGTALVDLLNIKYIILPKDVQFGEEPQPVEVGQIVGPYKVVMNADTVLLENLNVLPRVFPVHNAYLMKTREEILSALQHPEFNPAEFVILEEQPNVAMSPEENVPSSQSKAQITYYLNRTIQIQAAMATDGFLVLSEKYYQGWRAYVDGKPTKIYKADYTFQAIVVPKGEHVITFAYQPTDFLLGFIITTLTCVGLLAIWLYQKTSLRRTGEKLKKRAETILRKLRPFYYSKKLLWGLIVLGMLLHARQYLFNRSLHVDEASLSLNIINRSFTELLQPLDANQGAPIGFLMLEKLLEHIFGDSEYVLRFFPFVSALLSIFLFYAIASQYIRPATVPLTLGFFILSEPLIIYSSTVKQYSSDVFFALLIYAATLRLQSKTFTVPEIARFGAIGMLAMWCSHPAVFVLAGVGTYLLLSLILKKDWGKVGRLSIVCAIWAMNFVIIYIISLSHLNKSEYLNSFWAEAFLPFPPSSFADALWLPKFFIEFTGFATGLSQAIFNTISSHSIFKLVGVVTRLITSRPDETSVFEVLRLSFFGVTWSILFLIVAGFAVVGGANLFRRSKGKCCLLLLPVCFMLLASALQKFPLGSRLLLFLIPTVILLIGGGIGEIWEKRRTSPLIMLSLVGILLGYPVGSASYHLVKPRTDQEIKPVLQYVRDHQQLEDVFYIYYASHGVFTYYSKRFGLHEHEYIMGIRSRNNWNKYIQDIDQLRGQKRVWLIFSHVFGYEELMFLQYLDSIGGKRLDSLTGIKASTHLYDLRSAVTQE